MGLVASTRIFPLRSEPLTTSSATSQGTASTTTSALETASVTLLADAVDPASLNSAWTFSACASLTPNDISWPLPAQRRPRFPPTLPTPIIAILIYSLLVGSTFYGRVSAGQPTVDSQIWTFGEKLGCQYLTLDVRLGLVIGGRTSDVGHSAPKARSAATADTLTSEVGCRLSRWTSNAEVQNTGSASLSRSFFRQRFVVLLDKLAVAGRHLIRAGEQQLACFGTA